MNDLELTLNEIKNLARDNLPMFCSKVDEIIDTKCVGENHIERTFDILLDFCFIEYLGDEKALKYNERVTNCHQLKMKDDFI